MKLRIINGRPYEKVTVEFSSIREIETIVEFLKSNHAVAIYAGRTCVVCFVPYSHMSEFNRNVLDFDFSIKMVPA